MKKSKCELLYDCSTVINKRQRLIIFPFSVAVAVE